MPRRTPISRCWIAAFVIGSVCQTIVPAPMCADETFPGKKTDWHGFDRFDFEVDSRRCIVVTPKEPAEAQPWIWRARFFGHEPQADIALLQHGFHLVYCDVANLFGSPQAVAHWDTFSGLAAAQL